MPAIRSFIAVELSPPLRQQIENIQNELKRAATDVRWVRTEGIHLTLKFLGALDEARLEEVAAVLEDCLTGETVFTLTAGSLGAFPNGNNPKVIWLGVQDERGELKSVHETIERGLTGLGFKSENRAFSPHLTLGRVTSAKGRRAVSRCLETMGGCACGTFAVGEICLFKSELKPGGAVYTKLKSFVLSPQPKNAT